MSAHRGLHRRALLAGTGAVSAAAAGAAAHAPGAAGAGPDAELIVLCGEYAAAVAAYNADGGLLELEDDPLWQAIVALRRRLDGLAACTLAGVVAKARVAQALAQQPEREDYCSSFTGDWPEQVTRDLLHLHGGGAV